MAYHVTAAFSVVSNFATTSNSYW